MIELKNIEFSYQRKGKPALQGITTTVEPGIHLLAGENGAGKTTLLHLIAGVSHPTHGSIKINGTDPASQVPSEMGRVFLLEETQYFPAKSIRQFASQHSHFYPNFSPETFISNLSSFGLTGDESLEHLSLGNRKKSQLAYVLALGVDTLLLDEPTNALDIDSRIILRKLIGKSISDQQTVIISTHSVTEFENLYDGALILEKSHLIYAGSTESTAERISFEVSRMPMADAIYTETQIGRVLNIVPAEDSEATTAVDWRLLYSALHSPQRNLVLEYLNSEKQIKS